MDIPGFPALLVSKVGKLRSCLYCLLDQAPLGKAMLPTSLSLPDSGSNSEPKPELDIDMAGLLWCNLLGHWLVGLLPEPSLSHNCMRDPIWLCFLGLSPITGPVAATPAAALLIIMICMDCTTSALVCITDFMLWSPQQPYSPYSPRLLCGLIWPQYWGLACAVHHPQKPVHPFDPFGRLRQLA